MGVTCHASPSADCPLTADRFVPGCVVGVRRRPTAHSRRRLRFVEGSPFGVAHAGCAWERCAGCRVYGRLADNGESMLVDLFGACWLQRYCRSGCLGEDGSRPQAWAYIGFGVVSDVFVFPLGLRSVLPLNA